MDPSELLNQLRSFVGDAGVIHEPAELDPYLHDWRNRYHGQALCAVRPRTAIEVAHVLGLASSLRIPVYPQGGNTSLCGGSVPSTDPNAIVLSLSRMNRVVEVSAQGNSITVEAGCVLQNIQDAARSVDRLFPLSFGSEGSCQIGGNLATNAGGTGVLKYGNTRDLVLGLEVVLPDGRILDMRRSLRKDNRGYDLKNLFIGSEGTLGVITGAVLKLYPLPREFVTGLAAVDTPHATLEIALELQEKFQHSLVALELISHSQLEVVLRHLPGAKKPLDSAGQWYVLFELAAHDAAEAVSSRERVEECLADLMQSRVVNDAAIASSGPQRDNLWKIRHGATEANRLEGMGLTHDIGVPIGKVPEYLERAQAVVQRDYAAARVVVIGHLGDGNLHYIVMFGHDAWKQVHDKAALREQVGCALHDIAEELGGTFSAEHGIGAVHVSDMRRYKGDVELGLMRQLKGMIDPQGIMNPGRVIPDISRFPDAHSHLREMAARVRRDA